MLVIVFPFGHSKSCSLYIWNRSLIVSYLGTRTCDPSAAWLFKHDLSAFPLPFSFSIVRNKCSSYTKKVQSLLSSRRIRSNLSSRTQRFQWGTPLKASLFHGFSPSSSISHVSPAYLHHGILAGTSVSDEDGGPRAAIGDIRPAGSNRSGASDNVPRVLEAKHEVGSPNNHSCPSCPLLGQPPTN